MGICTAPVFKMEKLHNLFIEMTSKNCNRRCSSCYIDFPLKKEVKDFISIETVKQALVDTTSEELHCIYLTGAEPMTHPDFNAILRLCLKRCNVCICTNASFLNEKKIRFLKKVEDENSTQIFFRLSLAHYDESLSDKVKYRGNYRQNLLSLKILSGYNFTNVLSIQNFYKLSEQDITDSFKVIFDENNIKNTEIQISSSFPEICEWNENAKITTDCMSGRVLCANGVYSCPFLANDYRGRVGSSFKDYSKSVNAETDYCTTCWANKQQVFAIG